MVVYMTNTATEPIIRVENTFWYKCKLQAVRFTSLVNWRLTRTALDASQRTHPLSLPIPLDFPLVTPLTAATSILSRYTHLSVRSHVSRECP